VAKILGGGNIAQLTMIAITGGATVLRVAHPCNAESGASRKFFGLAEIK